MASGPPGLVRPGDGGGGVLELQRLLVAAGYTVSPAELGSFGPATETAVRAFQKARGLRVDGVCGPDTWGALVESGYRLGDRLLYRRHPMLRGDDVGELQQRLNALGFDAGRVDAVFGPHSELALREFQRNTGMTVDGVCGPETVLALGRVGTFAAGSVAAIREREALREPGRGLTDLSLYLAVDPGFGGLAHELASMLAQVGARVAVDVSDALDSQVAACANDQGADLLFGLSFGDTPGCSCDYFASPRSFRSESGYRVASRVLEELCAALGEPTREPLGRAYALLRETRMTAVVCQPSPAGDTQSAPHLLLGPTQLAQALLRGIRRGIEEPLKD